MLGSRQLPASRTRSDACAGRPCVYWNTCSYTIHPATTQRFQRRAECVRAAASDAAASTPSSKLADEPLISPKKEAQMTLAQYQEIYDRLIKIFQERPRDDWKKLIVLSKQWPQHSKGVFDRVRELGDQETDVDRKMTLRRLFRSLTSVAEEVARYNSVLAKFLTAGDEEWEAIVAVHRPDLQKPFFEHMQCLIAAARDDAEKKEQLVMINTRLVALCANYDSVGADQGALEQAAEVYRDLLSSISSIEEADKKMAELAGAGKIDPAFLQISAKAYGAARDTNMTLDEAKWVAYRLWIRAKDYFDRQQPKEKRIIEYLLSIADPLERTAQLDKAVTPGPEQFGDTHDWMWSTPNRLFLVLDGTLRAYEAMRQGAEANLAQKGPDIMPRKVRVMRELRDEIMRRYL